MKFEKQRLHWKASKLVRWRYFWRGPLNIRDRHLTNRRNPKSLAITFLGGVGSIDLIGIIRPTVFFLWVAARGSGRWKRVGKEGGGGGEGASKQSSSRSKRSRSGYRWRCSCSVAIAAEGGSSFEIDLGSIPVEIRRKLSRECSENSPTSAVLRWFHKLTKFNLGLEFFFGENFILFDLRSSTSPKRGTSRWLQHWIESYFNHYFIARFTSNNKYLPRKCSEIDSKILEKIWYSLIIFNYKWKIKQY